jgi:hypothetical protein
LHPDFAIHSAPAAEPAVQKAEIDADDAVVEVRCRIAIRDDHADARFPEHIGGDAADERGRRVDILESLLTDGERADVEAADTAADLAAIVEWDFIPVRPDAECPGKKRPAVLVKSAELEDIDILQEEVPPLRKEQAETCQVDLPVVYLRRRKVSVDCQ